MDGSGCTDLKVAAAHEMAVEVQLAAHCENDNGKKWIDHGLIH